MRKIINPDLLKRFLGGNTTPEESEFVEEWYQSFDKNKEDSRLFNPEQKQNLEKKIYHQTISGIAPGGSFVLSLPLKWAASIALLLLAGTGYLIFSKTELQQTDIVAFAEEQSVFKKVTNVSEVITKEVLPDGSAVELQPGSSIEFPEVFSEGSRQVQLTGEAFFDVTKDKQRPFIISTGDVTIKVLGTSFNVKAWHGASEVTVAVKTGKVLVYSKSKETSSTLTASNKEVILTPNQEVVYNSVEDNFTRKLVNEPEIILTKPTLFKMKYDGTPVSKIFKVLEENYGIDIVFDEKMFSGCSLTTSMHEEGLYERIEIICKAIGAEYEITDSAILISSEGCY